MTINQLIRSTMLLTGTTNSTTATIPTVNTAKSELCYCGDSGTAKSGGSGSSNWYLALTNSTTVTGTRNAPFSANTSASFEVTEWV